MGSGSYSSVHSDLRSDAFVTMELRRLPGAWFDSRTSWLVRTDARRTSSRNHWNVSDSSFPVRVENAALALWRLQGFFLVKDVRENPADQFHAAATAIADKVMTKSLSSLSVVHYPRQVRLDGCARPCGRPRSLSFACSDLMPLKRLMNARLSRQSMPHNVLW